MLPIQCLECPSLPAPLNWSQGSPVQSLSLACCLQLSHSYNPGSPVLKKEQAKRESVILSPTSPNQVLVTNLIIVSASPRNIILNQSI